MTSCSKCGDCCRAIALKYSKLELREGEQAIDGASFVLEHWHRISRKEAVKRLANVDTLNNRYYYECDQFDSEHNLCMTHDKRPSVCRDFPWYDHRPLDIGLKSAVKMANVFRRCSYLEDLRQPLITRLSRF